MIRITCTHCRQQLTIDDGFAGGVCRCQHCGTIQTVPAAPGKSHGRGPAPAAKTLYRREGRPPDGQSSQAKNPADSDLDQLAEIVSSSGLTHSARYLRAPSSGSNIPEAPVARKRQAPLLILAAVIILVLVSVIAMLLYWRNHPTGGSSTGSNIAPPSNGNSVTSTATGPNFCGMPIQVEDTVAYLLDNGGSAGDVLPAMNAACLQSIRSLGPNKRFKVIFWRDDGPVFPKDDSVRATPDQIAACQAAIQDAFALGNTTVDTAMKAAMTAQPDTIILVTAKAAELTDDSFTKVALADRGDSSVHIYTVGINGDSTTDPSQTGVLAELAAKTGGQFLNISATDLARQGQ